MTSIRVLRLFTDEPFTHTGSHLRGALLRQFPDRERLHNHRPDGRPRPSEVRYVVREEVPCVVGLQSGRGDLLELYQEVAELSTPTRRYLVTGKELLELPLELGPVSGLRTYRFGTPWLALNQANYDRFQRTGDSEARRKLLESIAVGNALTAAKAAGVHLSDEPRLEVRLIEHAHRAIRVADQQLLGFRATMVTNFSWSPWLGLGKMTSKGFGLLELER